MRERFPDGSLTTDGAIMALIDSEMEGEAMATNTQKTVAAPKPAHTPAWTPEPWFSGGCVVWGGDGSYLGDLLSEHKADTQEANAARIVACVNACAGIANPAAIPELIEAVRETLAWREEMAAILKALAKATS